MEVLSDLLPLTCLVPRVQHNVSKSCRIDWLEVGTPRGWDVICKHSHIECSSSLSMAHLVPAEDHAVPDRA
eukprot:6233051-Prorocentrum_lima.AAC.1